ncbi:hypothetical protein [Sandaracinus amylolyticus]|uniref:hypothetical protein n=1 Tax=Sandaracinus amylolyticus TaxID=927083 RepID=UPI00069D9051|nr:hypothetical protein [Sandaracinus amylolyticus]
MDKLKALLEAIPNLRRPIQVACVIFLGFASYAGNVAPQYVPGAIAFGVIAVFLLAVSLMLTKTVLDGLSGETRFRLLLAILAILLVLGLSSIAAAVQMATVPGPDVVSWDAVRLDDREGLVATLPFEATGRPVACVQLHFDDGCWFDIERETVVTAECATVDDSPHLDREDTEMIDPHVMQLRLRFSGSPSCRASIRLPVQCTGDQRIVPGFSPQCTLTLADS